MKNILLLLAALSWQYSIAQSSSIDDTLNVFEDKIYLLKIKQEQTDKILQRLSERQKENEYILRTISKEHQKLDYTIDSLRYICEQIEQKQSADHKNLNGKIEITDLSVRVNQDILLKSTIGGGIIACILIIIIIVIAYTFFKRIKADKSSIDEVRKLQEILQISQTKMQEESIKLDNQLLTLVQKQFEVADTAKKGISNEPDHSLVVKLADEIARIETNLSKMDKSVKGYKQLVQAKDRMINNVRANGYEIISLLGQDYNDGMQFQTRFVPDDSLPEGKRVISGMIKMQVNYNGKMIQPAEIVVSQNI